jgi:hypothetical protein
VQAHFKQDFAEPRFIFGRMGTDLDPIGQQQNHGIGARQARRNAAALDRYDSRLGLFKLLAAIVLIGLVVGVYPRLGLQAGVGVAMLAVLCFLLLAGLHRGVTRRRDRWTALARSYEAEAARRDRSFSALSEDLHEGALLTPWSRELARQSLPANHFFALDLDVARLLFPLLDTCATPEASEKLLDLLLAQSRTPDNSEYSSQVAQQRSARVRAIAPYTRLLRELDAARFAPDVSHAWVQGKACRLIDLQKLLAAEQVTNRILVYLGFGLVSIVAWLYLLLPAHVQLFRSGETEPYVASLLRYAVVPLIGLAVYRGVIETGNALRRRMASLELLMKDISAIRNAAPLAELAEVVARSRADLRNLRFALDLISSRSNPVFWLFVHAILPFDTLLCLATWLSIKRISGRFAQLTSGLVEFDCDAALSRFWNENPEFTFSEFIETGRGPLSAVGGACILEARNMGHPLLPRVSRVTNSVQWTATDRLVLLTGSNMSGKSTFLRTIGINAILHNIGAPVCATQFRAPVLQLLCAIRVDDALEAGTSYFYAEVKRLAALLRNVTLAKPSSGVEDSLPLYLIDEIFRGTNNRERFLGSLYVIRGFLETSSIGIVTTHDLSLTQLQQMDSVGRVRNMHFRETVESARLQFDYMLRSGPCPTTNALRIMHAEGLPVPAEISEVDEATLVGVMQVQTSPVQ